MRTHLRILSLILCLIITLSHLVACGDEEINETMMSDTNDTLAATEIIQKPVDNKNFVFFENGQYTAKFILPDSATASEKEVYAKLRNLFKSKTNTTVPHQTDFKASGTVRDPNEIAVLIGNTNYTESQNAIKAASYGDYAIKFSGNKMVLIFSSEEDGIALINILSRALKSNSAGTFYVDRSIAVSKQALPSLNSLPKYPGKTPTLVDCNGNTSMMVASSTSAAEFNQYCDALVKNGYKLHSSRDNVNNNIFRTYTKDSTAVTAYFTPYSKSARIIAGPITDIPSTVKDSSPETVTPSLTLISNGQNNEIGLGLIYLLPNGKFLIIDGGQVSASELYSLLQSLAPNKNNITITAWYISHAHIDHQNTIIDFLNKKYKNVTIESILYNYPQINVYKEITAGPEGDSGAQFLINTVKNNTTSTTKIIKPHTGQIYSYGSSTVEILYTVEDRLPQALDYLNTSSLVLRIKVGNHSMMALTDTTHVSGEILRKMYGSYLKTEMVQIAHHGFYAGHASLYEAIKGKVLIWPSNSVGAKKQLNDSTVKAALKYASDVYLANNAKHTTIKLPYTIKNNKQQVLNSLGG